MVSFLLILIEKFLFYRIHVRSLHWVCRIVPKTLNPRAHCTFGNVSSASTLASRQSNNILSYLFGSVWICWEKLNDVKWWEMGRDWKILWLDDEPPSQLAVMGKYSKVRGKKYWICFRTQLFFFSIPYGLPPFSESQSLHTLLSITINNQTRNLSRPAV